VHVIARRERPGIGRVLFAHTSRRDDLKADCRQLAEHYATLAEGEQKIAAYLKRMIAGNKRAASGQRGP